MSNEKIKGRLNSIDISALVVELKQKLQGIRINNIYDLNSKTYFFKLSKADTKEYLIIENGVRVHITTLKVEKNKMPSSFFTLPGDEIAAPLSV